MSLQNYKNMATYSLSSANSNSSSSGSKIPKVIKFGYTNFKVLSDAEPPKRTAKYKCCSSEKIFINGPTSVQQQTLWTTMVHSISGDT